MMGIVLRFSYPMKAQKYYFAQAKKVFSRKKNIGGLPILAIRKGLEVIDAKPAEISTIRLSTVSIPEIGISVGKKPRLIGQILSHFGTAIPRKILTSKSVSKLYLKAQNHLRKKLVFSQLKALNIKNANITFHEHHACHAASSIPFLRKNNNTSDTLIFTFDGSGDAKSGSVSIFSEGCIKRLNTHHTIDSIGEVYSQITSCLNMKPLEHEFKVMGLALIFAQRKKRRSAHILNKHFITLRFNKKSDLPYIKSLTNAWGITLKRKLKKALSNIDLMK